MWENADDRMVRKRIDYGACPNCIVFQCVQREGNDDDDDADDEEDSDGGGVDNDDDHDADGGGDDADCDGGGGGGDGEDEGCYLLSTCYVPGFTSISL